MLDTFTAALVPKPFDHKYVPPPDAVNVTVLGLQTVGLLGLIEAVGGVPVPTLTEAEAVQPPLPVTVTV